MKIIFMLLLPRVPNITIFHIRLLAEDKIQTTVNASEGNYSNFIQPESYNESIEIIIRKLNIGSLRLTNAGIAHTR